MPILSFPAEHGSRQGCFTSFRMTEISAFPKIAIVPALRKQPGKQRHTNPVPAFPASSE
jgi:hypothetical protein